jgi:hypothetical protein
MALNGKCFLDCFVTLRIFAMTKSQIASPIPADRGSGNGQRGSQNKRLREIRLRFCFRLLPSKRCGKQNNTVAGGRYLS